MSERLVVHREDRHYGTLVHAECFDRMSDVLDDLAHVHETVVAAMEGVDQIIAVYPHKFFPSGVSVLALGSESQLLVRTWPEQRYASIAFLWFLAGPKADYDPTVVTYIPEDVVHRIEKDLV